MNPLVWRRRMKIVIEGGENNKVLEVAVAVNGLEDFPIFLEISS